MSQPEKKLVYRAGLIPYFVNEGNEIEMMFMRPSDPDFGGDKFQIAKGKVEENEDHDEAAIREAKEELGLFIGNVIRTKEVGQFMGRTTVYVAKVKDPNAFGDPHFETSDTKWMTLEQFIETGRDLHKPVVKAAFRTIKKMEEESRGEQE